MNKIKMEKDFENFYQNEYYNTIEKYYDILKKKKKSILLFRVVIGIIISLIYTYFIMIFKFKSNLNNYYIMINIIFYLVLSVMIIISIYKSLKIEMEKINEYVIKDILAFISDNDLNNVIYEPKKKVSKESFDKMELFDLNIVKYNGKNYIKVPYNKNNMVFSDMHTYTYSIKETKKEIYKNGKKYIRTTKKKTKNTIFKGLYIGATLNKKNTNHIYLIPNNFNDTIIQSKIMKYIKFHGVSVMLENLDFSKRYKVFCNDEVQARYILSLSLMEKINEIDKLFPEKKYIVFKEGKRFAICIENTTIEDIKNIKLPIIRNEIKEINKLIRVFEQLNNLFKIYHILDLGKL